MHSSFIMKPGCQYSDWSEHSSWKAFYHEELGPTGSGPSKTSQKLALWYPGVQTDWPYIALFSLNTLDIIEHYQCTPEEALKAQQYIGQFLLDVEARFK